MADGWAAIMRGGGEGEGGGGGGIKELLCGVLLVSKSGIMVMAHMDMLAEPTARRRLRRADF